MTDRTHDVPPAPDDRTRDITLPPLPHRPPAALPREWAELRAGAAPVAAPATAGPGPYRPPAEPVRTPPETVAPVGAEETGPAESGGAGPADAEDRRLAGLRTDELVAPRSPGRERTLTFSAREMRHRSIEPVRVGSNPRRWPWVVLTLLPVLVIVGAGVAWLILLRGM